MPSPNRPTQKSSLPRSNRETRKILNSRGKSIPGMRRHRCSGSWRRRRVTRKTGRSLQKPRLMRTEQGKVDAITRKYAQFSKAAGLPVYKERMAVSGYRKVKVPQDTATSRLANRDKSGIIVLKSKDLPNGLSIRGKANSIVDKIDDTGVVLQSRKYDTDGKAIVDFDTSDHNRPDIHPTGAHKHIFDYSLKKPRRPWTHLTEQDLAENADIIRKGENYHDES